MNLHKFHKLKAIPLTMLIRDYSSDSTMHCRTAMKIRLAVHTLVSAEFAVTIPLQSEPMSGLIPDN